MNLREYKRNDVCNICHEHPTLCCIFLSPVCVHASSIYILVVIQFPVSLT